MSVGNENTEKELENIDEVAVLNESLGALESDIDVEVYKLDPGGAEYLFAFTAGEYTTRQLLDKIRDEEGTGKYQVQARKKNGTWAMRKQVKVRAPRNVSRETQAPVQAAAQQDLGAMMREMMQHNQTMLMQMQLENSKSMIEVLKTVAETKGGGGQQTDLLGMVALLKELSPKPVDSIGVLMQGIQMAQSFGEGKRDDDGLSGVLSKLGVPLMELVAAQQANAALAGAQQAGIPHQATIQQPGEQAIVPRETNVEEDEEVLKQQMIKAVVSKFVNMADSGNTPLEAAELFVERYGDMVPDDMLNRQGYEKLRDSFPDVAARDEWFGKMWEEVEKKIFE